MADTLIARLEAATEGSRELDAKVADARHIGFFTHNTAAGKAIHTAPHFTTSLDAALTLIPEGWRVANLWESNKLKDRPWWGAQLNRYEPYRMMPAVQGLPTPALALLIAIFKARGGSNGDR